jgi:hypothetical protein
MIGRMILAGGLLLLLIGTGGSSARSPQKKDKGAAKQGTGTAKKTDDLTNLSLEVEALQALHALEITNAQLKDLLSIAKECAEKPRSRTPAKASDAYRKVLLDLRNALIRRDADRIDELKEKLDDLIEKEPPEFDTDFETTATARTSAPGAFKRLEFKQLLAFVHEQGDTLADPRESILTALEEGKDKKGDEWTAIRNQTADAVAEVLAGANAAKVAEAARSVKALLDKWHGKPASTEAIDPEIKLIVGGQLPTDLLRNALEVHLASILSNPRMPAAMEARLNGGK